MSNKEDFRRHAALKLVEAMIPELVEATLRNRPRVVEEGINLAVRVVDGLLAKLDEASTRASQAK